MKVRLYLNCLAGLSTLFIAGCSPAPQTQPEVTPAEVKAAPQAPPDPASRWEINKTTNELDHTTKIVVSADHVYLRCSSKIEVFVIPTIESLGHRLEAEDGHSQTVRFRVDDQPIRKQVWSMSDDFEALFLPAAVIPTALNGKALVIEYKPDYVQRKSETFTVDGLRTAALKAGCKLNPKGK